MQERTFGRLGWDVGEIGYGMWGLAGWTGNDDEETAASLDRAVELGCNFFDTAWGYGEGRSERILGELLKKHPDKRLYVATKIPPKNFQWPSRRGSTLDDCFPPDHIREYTEKSLKNLDVATHRPPAVPRLGRRLGRRRPLDSDHGRPQARGLDPGRGRQRQPLGAQQRPQDPAHRHGRRRPGDLQHLRPGPQGRAVSALPRAGRRRHRPGPVRRGDAHRHAHQGFDLARGGLAEHLFRPREPRRQRRSGRGAPPARSPTA